MLPFFFSSFAVRNFSTISRQSTNREARAFRWKPRTFRSGWAATNFPLMYCSFHSVSLETTPQAGQVQPISSSLSRSNTMFAHSRGVNAPQAGQGTFHSSCVLCSNSTAMRDVSLLVGVETQTSFLFQNVARRFPASNRGSPSLPAVAGYRSISSASRMRMGRDARDDGEFAPTIVT